MSIESADPIQYKAHRCGFCKAAISKDDVICGYCGEVVLERTARPARYLDTTAKPEEGIWPPSPYQGVTLKHPSEHLWSGKARTDFWLGFIYLLSGFGILTWLGMYLLIATPFGVVYAALLILGWWYACREKKKVYPHLAKGMDIAFRICTAALVCSLAAFGIYMIRIMTVR